MKLTQVLSKIMEFLLSQTAKGIDQVEFYLSANPGEPLKPMSKVASGGEMSRIMLAIKTVFRIKILYQL